MASQKISEPCTLGGCPKPQMTPLYEEAGGRLYCTKVEEFLLSHPGQKLKGKVDLIFTSPPFPLNRKKAYKNLEGERYVEWLAGLAKSLTDLLAENGSIVIEVGNGWIKGAPLMSTLALEALLAFKKAASLNLVQEFICNNPAQLPGPAQWVNIERIRVTDSFTHVWWLSKSSRPKADNRNVLRPYSHAMNKLLARGSYNSGKRPSEHVIGKTSFLTNNSGAIPSNVLTFANTRTNDCYQEYCRLNELKPHPARIQPELPDFFIRFLTKPDDLVFDPFAGSNTTGAVAASLGRRWVGVEAVESYALGSLGRFVEAEETSNDDTKRATNGAT